MRHRFNDAQIFQTVQYHNRSSCSGGYTTSNLTSGPIGRRKDIWDVVVPGAKKTLKSGGLLPYCPVTIIDKLWTRQPVTQTGTIIGPPSCVRFYGSWWPNDSYFNIVPHPGLDNAAIAFVTNQAIADAKAESFDALTFAAELGSSSKMIALRINQVFNLAHKAGRKALRENGVHKQSVAFHNYWLELRYGWGPLVSDINGIMRSLHERPYVRNEGRASVTEDLSASSSPKVTSLAAVKYTGTWSRTGTRTYRGFALSTGRFGHSPEFRPFQTAWELVPFSFVVDWFLDVGSAIQAATPIPGVDIRASGYSVKEEYELSYDLSVSAQPGYTVTATPGKDRYTEKYYSRTPSGAVIPRFYPNLSTPKLVDIGALVLQRALPFTRFLRR